MNQILAHPHLTPDVSTAHPVSLGELIVDLRRYLVTYKQTTLLMTVKEIQILYALVAEEGKAVSRQQLYKLFWTDETRPKSNAVDFHIVRIRAKLWEVRAQISLVTLRGQGYAIRNPGRKHHD